MAVCQAKFSEIDGTLRQHKQRYNNLLPLKISVFYLSTFEYLIKIFNNITTVRNTRRKKEILYKAILISIITDLFKRIWPELLYY